MNLDLLAYALNRKLDYHNPENENHVVMIWENEPDKNKVTVEYYNGQELEITKQYAYRLISQERKKQREYET